MQFRLLAIGLAAMVLLAGCGAPGPGANETTPGDGTPTEDGGMMDTTTTGTATTTDGGTATATDNGTATGMNDTAENETATPTSDGV